MRQLDNAGVVTLGPAPTIPDKPLFPLGHVAQHFSAGLNQAPAVAEVGKVEFFVIGDGLFDLRQCRYGCQC